MLNPFKSSGKKNPSIPTSFEPDQTNPSFGLESLEPRLLLSADFDLTGLTSMGTLQLGELDGEGNQWIQIVDSDSNVFAEQILTADNIVKVTGTSDNDSLTLDESVITGLSIEFDGGDGSEDYLAIPDSYVNSIAEDRSSILWEMVLR